MKTILKIALPLLVIAAAYFGAKKMIANKPEPRSKQPAAAVPQVSTVTVNPSSHNPPVHSFGNIQSYFETTLTPQVAGAISSVSPDFRVGELVKKGTVLATIDKTDYQAIVARESAALASNQRQLAEEEIRADQAKSDWLASGRPLKNASDFVLRKPQLAAAEANVQSSLSAHKKALTDIERCSIIAPFDAVVTQRNASVGNYANSQSPLGRLIATQRAEVRLPLTPDQAARIQLPAANHVPLPISLSSPTHATQQWQATLTRTEPIVDPQNQVIYVIAEIANPYSGDVPLSVGTFVNATIPTKPLVNTLELPETALVNDDFVWAVDASNKLVKIQATRLHSTQNKAYIQLTESALKPPFTIVSRPLTNFRTGMKVSIETPSN